MNRLVRIAVAAAGAALALLSAGAAEAQVMCNDAAKLPDPIIVGGSTTFEATLARFAVKLSAEPTPSTILYATGAAGSCTGIASVSSGADLGGSTGYYYLPNGDSFTREVCTFAPGQKADAAVSDVFYESCANVPQPRPADVTDVTGPVQATVFVVPFADTTTQGLSYREAQSIYGCGVSTGRPIAGFADPTGVFCSNPDAGPQAIVARNVGIPPSAMVGPRCVASSGTTYIVTQNVSEFPTARGRAVGFITADSLAGVRMLVNPLAFQSLGQSSGYTLDSRPELADRRNVRDGHYTIWGYEHVIAKSPGGSPSRKAADLMGWISGTKANANIDPTLIASRAGLIPQCAMRVQRRSDGGLLSAYTPAQSCACLFQAVATSTIPPGCVQCASGSNCANGSPCRNGFCE